MDGSLVRDDVLSTPDVLLAQAEEHDAARARGLVSRLPSPRLLEVVLTQAQLAVEPGRVRRAGIDAIAELDRAAVELMGLAHGVTLDVSEDGVPLVTGWELLTVDTHHDLVGATTAAPARPWHLALIAFADHVDEDGVVRTVTAAAADGRMVSARLRFEGDPAADETDDVTVISAAVSRRLEDLGVDGALAWGLACSLDTAALPG
jgi:hypothetical protein